MMKRIIKFCLILSGLFSVREQADGASVNLALRAVASQSSTSGSCSADRAIDGGKDFITSSQTCAATVWEDYPWLRLDLQAAFPVGTVIVTFRDDSYPGFLKDFYVYFGDSLQSSGLNNPKCPVVSRDESSSTVTYSCGNRVGQYIVIRGMWINLAVCEVEVYQSDAAAPLTPLTASVESSRRSFLRLMLNSSSDLTNATVNDRVLQELTSALAVRGITNVTLNWSQSPEKEEVAEKPLENNSC